MLLHVDFLKCLKNNQKCLENNQKCLENNQIAPAIEIWLALAQRLQLLGSMETQATQITCRKKIRRRFTLCERDINLLGGTLLSVLLLFWGVFAFAQKQESVTQPQVAKTPNTTWRHTSKGWEQVALWKRPEIKSYRPGLHPAVIAAVMMIISMFGLLAFPSQAEKKITVVDHHHGR